MTNTISREVLDLAIELSGDYEAEVRDDYSGRGMYGNSCVGVVLIEANPAQFMIAIVHAMFDVYVVDYADSENDHWARLEAGANLAATMRTDSMGLSTIIYFPGVTIEE